MRTIIANTPDLWQSALTTTQATLAAGGAVIYPTDTLYALGVNALDPVAVERVFAIKGRPETKALPVAIGDISWVHELAYISPKQAEILASIWPSPMLVILRARPIVPDITTNARTITLRVPDHPFTLQLLKRYGYPITAEDISDPKTVHADLFVDLGVLPPAEPSTILDLSGDTPRILRVGATTPAHLLKLLEI